MFFDRQSPRREQAGDRAARAQDIDRAANRVANKVARERKEQIRRRKWAMETACLCANEMATAERIALARAIDDYVYEAFV